MNSEAFNFIYNGYGFWLSRTFRVAGGILIFPWWLWGVGVLRTRNIILKMTLLALALSNFFGFLYELGMWFWIDTLGVVGIITKNTNFSIFNIPKLCDEVANMFAGLRMIALTLNLGWGFEFMFWEKKGKQKAKFWQNCLVVMVSILFL